MGYKEIFDDIKSGNIQPLYLFHGPEEYIKVQALSQLTTALIQDDFKDLNHQVMDGAEVPMTEIINACETLPLMSDKRLIIVKDSPALSSKKSADEELLKKYLERLPASTYLIFYQHGDADKSRLLYKAIHKLGKIILFERLNDGDLSKWARSMFKKHHKEISGPDLQYLLQLVGSKLEDLNNEILKLVSFSSESSRIDRTIISSMVTPLPEYTIFQLLDALIARKRGEAFLYLNQLLEDGQNITGINAMLARQLKNMLLCQGYLEKGYKPPEIIEKLKLHPYAGKKCVQQCKNFTSGQLIQGLTDCLALDHGIKSGKTKDRMGLEMLIVKLCS